MKDLVLDLMDNSEDIDFILSRDTAYEVALALLDDGLVFEEMDEVDVFEEINNSVAIILSQVLTKEGYIYFIESYLTDDGEGVIADNEDGLIFIEEEIEDLIDYNKLYADEIIIIKPLEKDDEYEDCCESIYSEGFDDGYRSALEMIKDVTNNILEDMK